MQLSTVPSVPSSGSRISPPCLVSGRSLGNGFVQVAELLFHLADFVLQVEQHAMIEMLEFAIQGHEARLFFLGRMLLASRGARLAQLVSQQLIAYDRRPG